MTEIGFTAIYNAEEECWLVNTGIFRIREGKAKSLKEIIKIAEKLASDDLLEFLNCNTDDILYYVEDNAFVSEPGLHILKGKLVLNCNIVEYLKKVKLK